ncbi:glycoside hydrolase N-terminal domain-containing protein [Flavihumibacter sediminis]|nr:glycoside hydrolase N-terminal domain-containing protein [Flavihumibacter sediminis]
MSENLSAQQGDILIRFDTAAAGFTESLPLGNGRLGAMVYGGTRRERIALNEISLWSGGPQDADNDSARFYLKPIQDLLLAGNNREAQALLQKHFVSKGVGSGYGSGAKEKYGCYQALGDLFIDWRDSLLPVSGYERVLNIETAIATTTYTRNGATIKEELFTDFVNDIIWMKLSSSQKGGLYFRLSMYRAENARVTAKDNRLLMEGQLPAGKDAGMRFAAIAVPGVRDGNIKQEGNELVVEHASECWIRISAATNFDNETGLLSAQDPMELAARYLSGRQSVEVGLQAIGNVYNRAIENSTAFYQNLFNRNRWRMLEGIRDKPRNGSENREENRRVNKKENVRVNRKENGIGNSKENVRVNRKENGIVNSKENVTGNREENGESRTESKKVSGRFEGLNKITTQERLVRYAGGGSDIQLPVLYYNFGRYLLISSSRPGLLPTNLQGLWATEYQTPWNGDYHLNINIQMNYWLAETTNLGELAEPLHRFTAGLVENGQKTARSYYGAEGWVAHVISNPWKYTSPGEGAEWGSTLTGGAWLCEHIWEHWRFNRDTAFLRKYYPVLKGAAQFLQGILIKEPKNGWLVTAPSNSPENTYILPDGFRGQTAMGPTMDMQISRELFNSCIKASKILAVDSAWRSELKALVPRLAPNQVGAKGDLNEWLEDYADAEPRHRHVSHLYGLHPYDEITPWGTPALAVAARQTLLQRGDDGTGWSKAWKISFWARLGDGNHAAALVRGLLKPTKGLGIEMSGGGGTYANLFCAHPPFQIDGNFGAVAGIAEMLLQSHDTEEIIRFLPALPKEADWANGSIKGLKARGGFEVDMDWREGKLVRGEVRKAIGNREKRESGERASSSGVGKYEGENGWGGGKEAIGNREKKKSGERAVSSGAGSAGRAGSAGGEGGAGVGASVGGEGRAGGGKGTLCRMILPGGMKIVDEKGKLVAGAEKGAREVGFIVKNGKKYRII